MSPGAGPLRRFIPTYMGNAYAMIISLPVKPVHPHVHGERGYVLQLDVKSYGSSPRTWGTPVTGPAATATVRFIPTYMGNAQQSKWSRQSASVHPHVHGERDQEGEAYLVRTGSSPRTWGTHWRKWNPLECGRFIPTYMGNAIWWALLPFRATVHPHVHGERLSGRMRYEFRHGSSPRTWGTLESGNS